MTITLPKDLRAFQFPHTMPVTMSGFDVDVLLPALFYAVVVEGNLRGTRRPGEEATAWREHVVRLAAHSDVQGFDTPEGRRVLERLTRTAIVQMGYKGYGRKQEQINGLVPYSLLTFKPGFPEPTVVRGVDKLLHRMLVDALGQKNEGRGRIETKRVFEDTFGQGLRMTYAESAPDGAFDGSAELDCLTRLSIAFSEGFEKRRWRQAKPTNEREAIPMVARGIAGDLRLYLEAYRERMPTEALKYHFTALINFELFVYTAKLFRAVVDLVQHPDTLPPAMNAPDRDRIPSPPELYFDFTGEARGRRRSDRGDMSGGSFELAAACVRRDMETIQRFIAANLTLRQLDAYVQRMRGTRQPPAVERVREAGERGGPEYLQTLLQLRGDDRTANRLEDSAGQDEDRIRDLTDDNEKPVNDVEEIESVAGGGETAFDRLLLLMVEGQRATVTKNVGMWYQSVAGYGKPYGVLAGVAKSRADWRYAPGNDLLATLVQLAAVDIPKGGKKHLTPGEIGLPDFLYWLEDRYGILVDRPPAEFASVEATAAAKRNLTALTGRLRQMGVFRDLSDDFTVQRLTPPYATATATTTNATTEAAP